MNAGEVLLELGTTLQIGVRLDIVTDLGRRSAECFRIRRRVRQHLLGAA